MNLNLVSKTLIQVFVISIHFCSFHRRVHFAESKRNLVDSLNDRNKFRDGYQKFYNWPKLYRKKESSYYFYSKKESYSCSLHSQIPKRNIANIQKVSNRSGTVRGYIVSNTQKAHATFMSTSSFRQDMNHTLSSYEREEMGLIEEVVDSNNYNDELEFDHSYDESEGGAEDMSIIGPRIAKARSTRYRHESPLKNIVMQNCGISKGLGQRIVNGRDAEEGTYPWIVAILKFGDAWCGGTIINEWWIISASHCFMGLREPIAYVARVGTINRNIGQTYRIKKLIMHERFHLDNMFNSDIALLKVDKPIKMSNLVNGICFPSTRREEPKAASLIVAGWGATKYRNKDLPVKLQEISLKRISDGQCARKYKIKSNTIYRSQICTSSFNKDACQGDSGGPAIEIRNSRAILVGIVSYGSKCADEFPGVYTQVSYFLDWIANTINKNSEILLI